MSGAPKPIKLKLVNFKRPGDAQPAASTPSAAPPAPAAALPAAGPSGQQAAAAAVPERKPMPIKLKVKAPPGAAVKRPAEGPGGAQPPPQQPLKKIKLVTGPKPIKLATGGPTGVPAGGAAAAAGGAAAAGAGAVRPKIRLKTNSLPPKQPSAAAAAGGEGGGLSVRDLIAPRIPASGGGGAPPLPTIRLTLPPGAAAGASGGAKKPARQRQPKKAAAGAAKGGAGGGGGPGGRAKRQRKEAALLPLSDEEGLDGPTVPRAPSARHAAAAAAPSEAGPQPSSMSRGSLGDDYLLDDDDDLDDVAFTAAPQALPPAAPSGEPGAEQPAGPPPLPVLPPLPEGGAPAPREDLERVVRLVQKKDVHGIFKDPVTEDVAPGYFTVIKEPMDFATMRGKLERGQYVTYEDLQRDLRLMFLNAMTYNPPDTPFYSHARNVLFAAEKLVEQARQGVLSQRQAAGEARKQNAQARAAERAARDALRAQARAEQKAAQEAKVLKRAGVGEHHEESLDESIRNSYRRPLQDLAQTRWRGLGGGASAEGAALGWGRQLLRPTSAALAAGSYAASLLRFAVGMSGKARECVLARAAAATPNADAAVAERLLQRQLARQPPPPPAPPAAIMNPALQAQMAFAQQMQAQQLQQAQLQQAQQRPAVGSITQAPTMLPTSLSTQQLAAMAALKQQPLYASAGPAGVIAATFPPGVALGAAAGAWHMPAAMQQAQLQQPRPGLPGGVQPLATVAQGVMPLAAVPQVQQLQQLQQQPQ